MAISDSVDAAINKALARKARPYAKLVNDTRASLPPDAPAPQINAMIADKGETAFKSALKAWDQRLHGIPIVDVAHELGVSIEVAKELIKEAHAAIADDLKDNLELNRTLDLGRIDGLIQTYYPQARAGETNAAHLIIKALQHRAKLTGIEPQPAPGRSSPENVLIWIQNQLPQINQLVDTLPLDS